MKRKRRPTKADAILADPAIVRALAASRQVEESKDLQVLTNLFKLLHDRVMQPLRCQRCRVTVRRDPRGVVFRYLRRFRGGLWYRGGSHVARYDYGPGIAWKEWRNDRAEGLQCSLINVTLALPST